MSGRSDGEPGFDLAELWRLLEDVEEGVADPARGDGLVALLERSPAARRAYLEYFQQSAVLRMEAAKLRERGLLPVVGSAQQTRRAFQRSVLAAAAVVALAAVVAALIAVTRPEPARLAAAVAAETQWSVDGVEQTRGDEAISVAEGSRVRVASGTLKLEMESGDAMVVQGPAEVFFPTLHRPQLRRGWLWIDAGKSDESFQVGTPSLRIRNIGTRFGVRVAAVGVTEVHLVSGRLEVSGGKAGTPVADLAEPGKAFAFSAAGAIEEIPLAGDPFPSLLELLRQPADYRTTVLGQAPVGYWRLDDPPGQALSNEISASSVGRISHAVRQGEPGVGVADVYAGFADAGHSLYLDGSEHRSVVHGIDGLNGVSRREGAVSFWIRRLADAPQRDETLWLAGPGEGELPLPSAAILHTRLTSAGRVVFEIENEGDDVSLASARSVANGGWHHVVASWGAASVDLFIDGQLVARDSGKRTLREGSFRGRYVRFGKPGLDGPEGLNPFTGWVDEIALWDRPLSPTEVGIQYRSALGLSGGSPIGR